MFYFLIFTIFFNHKIFHIINSLESWSIKTEFFFNIFNCSFITNDKFSTVNELFLNSEDCFSINKDCWSNNFLWFSITMEFSSIKDDCRLTITSSCSILPASFKVTCLFVSPFCPGIPVFPFSPLGPFLPLDTGSNGTWSSQTVLQVARQCC